MIENVQYSLDKIVEGGVVVILGVIVLFLAFAFIFILFLALRFFKAFALIQESNSRLAEQGQKNFEKIAEIAENSDKRILNLEEAEKKSGTKIEEIRLLGAGNSDKIDLTNTGISEIKKEIVIIKNELVEVFERLGKMSKQIEENEGTQKELSLIASMSDMFTQLLAVLKHPNFKSFFTEDAPDVISFVEKIDKIELALEELKSSNAESQKIDKEQ